MTRRPRGAALPITLVLLSALGALALAAAAAAAAALALASHQQMSQAAFEAAEAGIALALVRIAATRRPGSIPPTPHPDEADASARFEAQIAEAAQPGALPIGFSVGENPDTFAARHFFIVADGRAGRGSRVRLEQGLYLVVPAP